MENNYHETLLIYLHSKRFQYYLSGVYFWETFRAQTLSLLLHCLSCQAIPLFHYCSDCLNRDISCCRLWLQNACTKASVSSSDSAFPEPHTISSNNLMLLAAVASKELAHEETKPTQMLSNPRRSSKKVTQDRLSKLQKCKVEKEDKKQKEYIEQNHPSLLVSHGIFTERMMAISTKILQTLHEWSNITPEKRKMFYRNVRYAVTIVNREAPSHEVRLAGTLQVQGASNYCGLCALNNLLGKDAVSVRRINNIADDLWLRQIEQFEQTLTENLQCHRDINGFYSFQTIEETLECFGFSADLLSENTSLRAMLR